MAAPLVPSINATANSTEPVCMYTCMCLYAHMHVVCTHQRRLLQMTQIQMAYILYHCTSRIFCALMQNIQVHDAMH